MDITKACRDINELSPSAKKACELFLAECKKQGLPVLITETYRPQSRQDYLYAQGRTRAGQIVTWTKNSRHTSRRAWDICKNVRGQEYSDAQFFAKCGAIAKKLGITWGGTWNTPDKPHFEIDVNWKEPKKEVSTANTSKGDDEVITREIIIVNDKEYTVEMIRKDGYTFIKTRDFGTACGYDVSSNGKTPVFKKK